MASGAAATAAVGVFAILVLYSLGHPLTGPLCSNCGSLCDRNCTAEVATRCSEYCDNISGPRQECERQVLQACTQNYCSNGNCSRNCTLVAQDGCNYVHSNFVYCENCKMGIQQTCIHDCNRNCNSTCVNKEHGC